MKGLTTTHTLKALQLVHRALLLGQLLFAGIVFLLKYTNSFPSSLQELDNTLQVVAIVLCFGGYFIGASIFKRRIQQVVTDSPFDTKAKAATYRSVCVIQWALLEGPSLFCIICFLLVGNIAFLALAATSMLVLALLAPSRLKVMMLLRINETEMEAF